ncbi:MULTISPECIES: type II secretion system protein N [unclassified Pseudomonas]|uniref:type II secretion system protein N n=1 Tax=unclassified Pseudomonas TaxID=196821 RepID=UPI00119B44C6|nr:MULTISPECIES: type II secretion system protein N [unclassified Pseudomonas]TWC10540.1 type II secretion system (T2SS) protein C [Pseudomonas sp. SJZ075]TWC26695.1 type II secretion system (T2SS) protein C [Pseudomonas sp. SJZ078]TWC45848.1 type II secretion system (T2SS) protein C [Pseudomonas sp. SJZ124]TWC46113.1 type II secretion system (T2SS) protein C [Pseudomonas sp. SJZ080]TWC81137.1 type II secretion system (T2SS) protein C [Pseudomonas sp. SJZ101]
MIFLHWSGHHLPKALLVLVPLLYGGFLAEREWRFRQELPSRVPVVAAPAIPQSRVPLNVQAVATVLGLTPQEAQLSSAEPITLQASFVSDQGLSRALLADATSTRIYQVGERLPGGSVLRRVEATHVLLWRNGREEKLALKKIGQPLLRQLGPEVGRQTVPYSSQYIRPVAGQSE